MKVWLSAINDFFVEAGILVTELDAGAILKHSRGVVVFAFSALASTQGVAQGFAQALPSMDVGGGYYIHCVLIDPNKSPDVQRIIRCTQYIGGIDDGIAAATKLMPGQPICVNQSATLTQKVDALERFLSENQGRFKEPTATLYLASLLKYFPCSPPPPGKRM